MLHALSSLPKLSIRALDGEIGSVKDSYFDDHRWVLRYIVIDTGGWLPGREVLVSPYSVSGIDWERRLLDLSITREQVKSSPSIDMDKPVSRQQEAAFLDYYNYPYYWGGMMPWGVSASPAITRPPPSIDDERRIAEERARAEHADPNLRSTKHVTGYHIEASDGMIGHVDDFIIDEQTWELRFFVVDTRNWLPGRHVLLATEWIDEVSWDKRAVRVALTRAAIRSSPEWHEQERLDEREEQSLYRHYGKTLDAGIRGGQLR